MSGWRGHLLLIVIAVLAGLAGLWFGRQWSLPPEQPVPAGVTAANVGEQAPNLSLPELGGQSRHLADWRGRPLLVNFWASWCGPCVKEMPVLDAFAAEQAGNGMQVIGIALDNAAAVRDFLQRVPVQYPILMDSPGPRDSSVWLGNTRGVLPYSVLIDAQGVVRKQHLGEFDAESLRRWAFD